MHMNLEDVEKLSLIAGGSMDIPSGKPNKFSVSGLPSHLTAKIEGTDQARYDYQLTRKGQTSLKGLLLWDAS
jgi:hypothetical protein